MTGRSQVTIRLAAIQARSLPGQIQANLDHAAGLVEQAAACPTPSAASGGARHEPPRNGPTTRQPWPVAASASRGHCRLGVSGDQRASGDPAGHRAGSPGPVRTLSLRRRPELPAATRAEGIAGRLRRRPRAARPAAQESHDAVMAHQPGRQPGLGQPRFRVGAGHDGRRGGGVGLGTAGSGDADRPPRAVRREAGARIDDVVDRLPVPLPLPAGHRRGGPAACRQPDELACWPAVRIARRPPGGIRGRPAAWIAGVCDGHRPAAGRMAQRRPSRIPAGLPPRRPSCLPRMRPRR